MNKFLVMFLSLILTVYSFAVAAGGGSTDLGDGGNTVTALARVIYNSRQNQEIYKKYQRVGSLPPLREFARGENLRVWRRVALQASTYFQNEGCRAPLPESLCRGLSPALLDNIWVKFTPYPLIITYERADVHNPLSLSYADPERMRLFAADQVDALNFRGTFLIKVEERAFRNLPTRLAQFVLVIHEYLGILAIPDDGYFLSTLAALRILDGGP